MSIMDWAAKESNEINLETLENTAKERGWHENDDHMKLDTLLFNVLVDKTAGEAFKTVRHGVEGGGVDAWRRMSKEYHPANLRIGQEYMKKDLERDENTKERRCDNGNPEPRGINPKIRGGSWENIPHQK